MTRFRVPKNLGLPLLVLFLLGSVAPQAEAQISVLVDATTDGGVWQAPNTQGGGADIPILKRP